MDIVCTKPPEFLEYYTKINDRLVYMGKFKTRSEVEPAIRAVRSISEICMGTNNQTTVGLTFAHYIVEWRSVAAPNRVYRRMFDNTKNDFVWNPVDTFDLINKE